MTDLIEEQVARTPDAPAVVFGDVVVTYQELNARANKLARYLSGQGVTIDTLVGVYMERSLEMVVALVGILKSGGAYVPFDPDYPQDRLAFMFEDSGVSVVLTQRPFRDHELPPGIERILLDDPLWASTDGGDAQNPPLVSRPESAAYMIYTSGSTGKPKGVINIHRGLVNRLLWMQDEYHLTAADRVLQKTPYSFDVSVWEFFWPLITGASIVMAAPGGHRESQYLIDTIVSQRVTTMHFVPSMLNLFVGADGLDRIQSLRQVMSSGEALPLALTKRFFEQLPRTRLHNLYGPTEASIDVTYWECKPDSDKNVVPIGYPIANTQMYILDEAMNPVAVGDEGELHIGGIGLARGYWNRPELNAERFVKDPFSSEPGARLYKTGDLARYLPDGAIEYLGRLDFQIKLRGFRIELGEIEAVLLLHPGISETVIVASDDALEEKQLVAYCVTKPDARPAIADIKKFLLARLPEYMVPARFQFLSEMPLLPNGKVNRKALPKDLQERPELVEMFVSPRTPTEVTLGRLWARLLNLKEVGIRDNFFDLGGNSLKAIRLATEIRKEWQREVPVVKIFQYPTIEKLALHLNDDESEGQKLLDGVFERATRIRIGRFSGDGNTDGVAVIGMVGRFPGAPTVEQLWENLLDKVESISRFSLEEMTGVDDETKNDPNYVPTRGIVTDADKFDASFFGIGPLEAKVMDPQQRVFLELAWAALENAGYDPEQFPGMIGVFAGVGDNHYYPNNVLGHPDLIKTVGKMIVGYGNEKDYVATRASYSLNLTGPSVSANTGCSTSLLSVDHAFKSLIDFECDMALAGGVDLFFPQKSGQLYEEGGTFTQDGHCRPFDEQATGTMFCDGAGIVVLRRLEDAIAAGDTIYAVVRGVAKNNDGANKVSFLAPSVEGQAQVIALAQAQADTPADTISYIEAHGTGTPLGDPIEIEALTRAFRATTAENQFCHIGSIKGNIGHPTIASGVAGFMKATLALHHETIPATLHFNKPNPKIDFQHTPFKVADDTIPWPRTNRPRRAGVSSFGFGGTNVHAILEESPAVVASGPSRPQQVLLLSAKTEAALNRQRRQFAEFFQTHPDGLADAAFTLVVGRRHQAFRDFVVASDAAQAASLLAAAADRKQPAQKLAALDPGIVFLFPGQGSQYINMGRSLYQDEPVFRQWVDTCCDLLKPHLDRDLRELLFPKADDEKTATESLKDTYYTQPALFTVEYSLARFWMSLGIVPAAMVGHSVGEFVCACLSGIVTLEEILPMVALRGRLIRGLPRGSMLSVRCPAHQIQGRLPDDIQLAASNGPSLCVVAGPAEAVTAFGQVLEAEGLVTRELHTSHAFHSAMMEPVVGQYVEAMRKVTFSKGRIPILSTCTADWLSDEVAATPEYWGRHLRMPVLFSDAVLQLLKEPGRLYLEVGPRDVLTTLVRQHVALEQRDRMIPSLGANSEDGSEWRTLLGAVGQLWRFGVTLDWNAFYSRERRGRVPLPTYPFERTSHWLEPVATRGVVGKTAPEVTIVAEPASRPHPEVVEAEAQATDNSIQIALSAILQDTLGIAMGNQVLDTPFLTLGADSLLLMQLGRIIQNQYGLRVTFRQLVEEYATPRLLAEAIGKTAGAQTTASTPPAAPVSDTFNVVGDAGTARLGLDNRGKPAWFLPHPSKPGQLVKVVGAGVPVQGGFSYPSSPVTYDPFLPAPDKTLPANASQKAMQPGAFGSANGNEVSCAFGESFTIRLQGAINDRAVESALQALPVFHEALRGHLSPDGSSLVIAGSLVVPVLREDLSRLSPTQQEAGLNRLVDQESRTPYDLAGGPLVRALVVRLSDDRLTVVLGAHRLVCDGWSLDVVLEDFSKLYSAYAGLAPLPPPPQMAISDFQTYRHSPETTNQVEASRAFWSRHFTSLPAKLELAPQRNGRRPDSLSAVHHQHRLSPEAADRVRRFAKTQGTSLFAVLLAGVAAVVGKRSGSRDFLIGVPMAGHPEARMEDAVGPLATMVPVRLNPEPGQNFAQFCGQVHRSVLEGRENSVLNANEVLPPECPVTVAFSHMHLYSQEKLKFEGCASDYQLNPRAFEAYELSINLMEGPDSLELLSHTRAGLYDEDWLRNFHREFERDLLQALGALATKTPDTPRLVVDPPIVVTLKEGNPGVAPLISLLGIQLYYDLAQAIDPATPVIGVHVPMRYDPRHRPSLTEVAQYYFDLVRTIQPQGPYHLAGLCLGGMVAYEVARLLEAERETVKLVVLFDAVLPKGRHIDKAKYVLGHLSHPIRSLFGVVGKGKSKANAALQWASTTAKGGLIELPMGTPGVVRDIEKLGTSGAPLNAHLLAFRAAAEELPPWDQVHVDMGWASTAASLQLCSIDADHLGIVRPPHAKKVAEVINRALGKAL